MINIKLGDRLLHLTSLRTGTEAFPYRWTLVLTKVTRDTLPPTTVHTVIRLIFSVLYSRVYGTVRHGTASGYNYRTRFYKDSTTHQQNFFFFFFPMDIPSPTRVFTCTLIIRSLYDYLIIISLFNWWFKTNMLQYPKSDFKISANDVWRLLSTFCLLHSGCTCAQTTGTWKGKKKKKKSLIKILRQKTSQINTC